MASVGTVRHVVTVSRVTVAAAGHRRVLASQPPRDNRRTLPDGARPRRRHQRSDSRRGRPRRSTCHRRLIALGTDPDRVHIVDGVVRDNDERWVEPSANTLATD